MNWAETRNAARRVVHDTFKLACDYVEAPPDGAARTIHVRLHTRLQVFGDLDREGYARVMEDVNNIMLDDAEGPFKARSTITFQDSGQRFFIDYIAPHTDGSGFRRAQVVPDNSPPPSPAPDPDEP